MDSNRAPDDADDPGPDAAHDARQGPPIAPGERDWRDVTLVRGSEAGFARYSSGVNVEDRSYPGLLWLLVRSVLRLILGKPVRTKISRHDAVMRVLRWYYERGLPAPEDVVVEEITCEIRVGLTLLTGNWGWMGVSIEDGRVLPPSCVIIEMDEWPGRMSSAAMKQLIEEEKEGLRRVEEERRASGEI